jgi:hypothetical protein
MRANETPKTSDTAARFKVGDRVRVRNMPNMFYTRTQSYVRGAIGTIAACTYKDQMGGRLLIGFQEQRCQER